MVTHRRPRWSNHPTVFRMPLRTRFRPAGRSEPSPPRIRVSTGSGAGPTRLAAFDAALFDAGVAGYNMVRLSSVIPAHAEVREVAGSDQIKDAVGSVAYCVYAASYARTPGAQAWAGMAWALHDDRSGVGLFVEHTASSEWMLLHDLESRSRP